MKMLPFSLFHSSQTSDTASGNLDLQLSSLDTVSLLKRRLFSVTNVRKYKISRSFPIISFSQKNVFR